MIETFADPLPQDIHRQAIALMSQACDQGVMLAVAESCTGGLLAAVLTDVEGCAHGFDRGVVAYTDEAKADLLSVPRVILETDGAVSPRAAEAMAVGVLEASKADIALSVTGFAGAGAPAEEAGLVYFGLAARSGFREVVERRFGPQSRAAVRLGCLRTAMSLMSEGLTRETA